MPVFEKVQMYTLLGASRAKNTRLRMRMSTFAFRSAMRKSTVRSARSNDGRGQTLAGDGSHFVAAARGLTSDGQIQGGEVASTRKRRRDNEAVLLIALDLIERSLGGSTVLLVSGAELGQLGMEGRVEAARVAAVLVIVVLVLQAVFLDLFISASPGRG